MLQVVWSSFHKVSLPIHFPMLKLYPLHYYFFRSVLTQFSWTGVSRKVSNKEAFNKLGNILGCTALIF